MKKHQVFSLFLASIGLAWATPALAQSEVEDEGLEVELAEAQEDRVTAWSFEARIRPRVEGRFNHRFGLDEEVLNYTFQPDEADQFTQQSRLGATVESDDLSGHFTLQHTGTWGEFGGNELTAPPVQIYEARLRYRPHEVAFVDVGRFELAYGDQRVLGSVGWSQVGRAWDGLRTGVRPHEQVAVDGFAARYSDGGAGFIEGDSYLFGVYGTVLEPVEDLIEEVDLYVLYDVANLDQQQGRDLAMVGTRLQASFADVDATAEGVVQYSWDCEGHGHCGDDGMSIFAFFADAEVGYSVADLRPFVGASVASGNDPETDRVEAYDQLYPTGHAWLGYMDIIGPRTNLVEGRLGAQSQLAPFNIQLAGHHFRRLQPQSEPVGTELNTKVFADLTEGLVLAVGGGVFFATRGFSSTDAAPEGVARWAFGQLVGSF